MLPSRVNVPIPANPQQEDFFSAGLGTLFSDDTQNSHGTPGDAVIYTSPLYGEITLKIPRHPDVEEGRKLFAHYLWNAGVVAADAIEVASNSPDKIWSSRWNVKDKNVLELGAAGTALPSLVAALAGAKLVTITDHPSSPALITDVIAENVKKNLKIDVMPKRQDEIAEEETAQCMTQISIHGLTWGIPTFMSSVAYGKKSNPQPEKNSFDTMIIADCLWMPSQHVNLVRSIDQNLKKKDTSDKACALVIAGYHTGRNTVARFFQIATGTMPVEVQERIESGERAEIESVQDLLRLAEIFEVDVDCNVRPWQDERKDENKETAKRWVVCAVLERK